MLSASMSEPNHTNDAIEIKIGWDTEYGTIDSILSISMRESDLYESMLHSLILDEIGPGKATDDQIKAALKESLPSACRVRMMVE